MTKASKNARLVGGQARDLVILALVGAWLAQQGLANGYMGRPPKAVAASDVVKADSSPPGVPDPSPEKSGPREQPSAAPSPDAEPLQSASASIDARARRILQEAFVAKLHGHCRLAQFHLTDEFVPLLREPQFAILQTRNPIEARGLRAQASDLYRTTQRCALAETSRRHVAAPRQPQGDGNADTTPQVDAAPAPAPDPAPQVRTAAPVGSALNTLAQARAQAQADQKQRVIAQWLENSKR